MQSQQQPGPSAAIPSAGGDAVAAEMLPTAQPAQSVLLGAFPRSQQQRRSREQSSMQTEQQPRPSGATPAAAANDTNQRNQRNQPQGACSAGVCDGSCRCFGPGIEQGAVIRSNGSCSCPARHLEQGDPLSHPSSHTSHPNIPHSHAHASFPFFSTVLLFESSTGVVVTTLNSCVNPRHAAAVKQVLEDLGNALHAMRQHACWLVEGYLRFVAE